MEQTLSTFRNRFPTITYKAGKLFYWSPQTAEVYYNQDTPAAVAMWSLLHETSHALLGHASYHSDFELVRLEVAAWERAKLLALEFGTKIDENHIQDCLDTYRDWICARSVCPRCSNRALQQADLHHYQCFNCRLRWKVTPSRFCRAYRAAVAPKSAFLNM